MLHCSSVTMENSFSERRNNIKVYFILLLTLTVTYFGEFSSVDTFRCSKSDTFDCYTKDIPKYFPLGIRHSEQDQSTENGAFQRKLRYLQSLESYTSKAKGNFTVWKKANLNLFVMGHGYGHEVIHNIAKHITGFRTMSKYETGFRTMSKHVINFKTMSKHVTGLTGFRTMSKHITGFRTMSNIHISNIETHVRVLLSLKYAECGYVQNNNRTNLLKRSSNKYAQGKYDQFLNNVVLKPPSQGFCTMKYEVSNTFQISIERVNVQRQCIKSVAVTSLTCNALTMAYEAMAMTRSNAPRYLTRRTKAIYLCVTKAQYSITWMPNFTELLLKFEVLDYNSIGTIDRVLRHCLYCGDLIKAATQNDTLVMSNLTEFPCLLYEGITIPVDKHSLTALVDLCNSSVKTMRIILISSIIPTVVLTTIILALCAYILIRTRRRKMNAGPLERTTCLTHDDATDFKYIVFISYSHRDYDFLTENVFAPLHQHLRDRTGADADLLCTGDRNFRLGKPVLDEMIGCLEQSAVVLVILSNNYVQSRFCQMEFDHALSMEKRIILMVKDRVNEKEMSSSLRLTFRNNTRILWDKDGDHYRLKTTWDNVCTSILELAGDLGDPNYI